MPYFILDCFASLAMTVELCATNGSNIYPRSSQWRNNHSTVQPFNFSTVIWEILKQLTAAPTHTGSHASSQLSGSLCKVQDDVWNFPSLMREGVGMGDDLFKLIGTHLYPPSKGRTFIFPFPYEGRGRDGWWYVQVNRHPSLSPLTRGEILLQNI